MAGPVTIRRRESAMKIEDAVGPIIMGAFVLALIIEALLPRETQPKIRGWRFLGIIFFVVSSAIAVVLPLLIPGEWVAKHSLLPGMRLGVAGGFAVGFVTWSFLYYWYHRSEHRFDVMWRALHQLHHSPKRVDVMGFAVSSFRHHCADLPAGRSAHRRAGPASRGSRAGRTLWSHRRTDPAHERAHPTLAGMGHAAARGPPASSRIRATRR